MNRDNLAVMWGIVILIGFMFVLVGVSIVTWVHHTVEAIGFLMGTTDVLGALS